MTTQVASRWLPRTVAKYYGLPFSHSGKGQTIAIVSMGGAIDLKDLKRDFATLQLPFPNIRERLVHGEAISPTQEQQPVWETHLDVEVIGSLCPEADITIYRGPIGRLDDIVMQAVADRNSVISISWGKQESADDRGSKLEKALARAKKLGLTVCVAAGDLGSSCSLTPDGKSHVVYPASSRHVLACGGTELIKKKGRTTEAVWNNMARDGGATGGGVSEIFPLPAWQVGAGINVREASTDRAGRVVPDVAGLAAADWKIVEKGASYITGGTSAVAPLWASIIALVNEARGDLGKSALGFINERLYKLAAKGGLFNDITRGNNRPSAEYPGYRARVGFDACTGWGSPVGAKIFKALIDLD